MKNVFLHSFLLSFHLFLSHFVYGVNENSLSNSCIGKTDGEYWLQLAIGNENYVPLRLKCSNEYVILDINKDNDLSEYFSSWQEWHYAIAGPINRDAVTWEEWFLGSDEEGTSDASYLISPDCGVCDDTADKQVFDTKTSYWMTGNIAKIRWSVVGSYECDWNKDTYECMDCISCSSSTCQPQVVSETATDYSSCGACGVAVQASNSDIIRTRNMAEMSKTAPHYKPSIGTDGRFCVCYKPNELNNKEYTLTDTQKEKIEEWEERTYEVSNHAVSDTDGDNKDTDKNTWSISEAYHRVDGHELIIGSDMGVLNVILQQRARLLDKRNTNIVYLSQSDFEEGTYRIKESGTYIINEDIIFDFNANDDYWPRSDQSDEYDGSGAYRGPYHMGFFAGIAIEADYVTIDLNSHSLRQSNAFFFQQRWFSIIELGNQQFLPGQGPSFFGANSINVESITITNGVLGLTSHFAIHGNFATKLVVTDVHIRDFVTHGMQLNGWSDLIMNNVEVGPSCTIDYLRGDYGHARLLMLRLNDIYENELIPNGLTDKSLHFSNREDSVTFLDIKDELEAQMDLALQYSLNKANGLFAESDYIDTIYLESEEDHDRWMKAKKAFVHESGFPSPSSLSGLFLNFEGASVFTYAKYSNHPSSNGKLTNIYIHDLTHDMSESLRMAQSEPAAKLYTTPFGNDFPAEALFGSEETCLDFRSALVDELSQAYDKSEVDISSFKYVGSCVTDAYIAMGTFSDDWDYLGLLALTQTYANESIALWAFGESTPHFNWRFNCNQDTMFHSGKGLFGLRVDGTSDLVLDNIVIENLHDKTPFGSDACGSYVGASASTGEGGHLRQDQPMQTGFSGNNLQGLSIISSQNIEIGDISVNNLKTDYGDSYGVSLWTANNIIINEDSLIQISNIVSGLEVEENTKSYTDYPNRAPEACAFRIETDPSNSLFDTYVTYNLAESSQANGLFNVMSCSVSGHSSCLGSDLQGNTVNGVYLSDDSSVCESVTSVDELKEYLGASRGAAPESQKAHISGIHSNSNNNNDIMSGFALGYSSMILIAASIMIVLYCAKRRYNNPDTKQQTIEQQAFVSGYGSM